MEFYSLRKQLHNTQQSLDSFQQFQEKFTLSVRFLESSLAKISHALANSKDFLTYQIFAVCIVCSQA